MGEPEDPGGRGACAAGMMKIIMLDEVQAPKALQALS